METIPNTPKTSRFPRELFTVCLMIVVLWGMWVAQAFFIPISLAALLAFLMAPVMRFLRRHKVPEWMAILLSVILLLLPVAFVLVMVAKQGQSLMQDYPAIAASAHRELLRLAHTSLGQRLHLAQQLSMSTLTERLSNGAGEGIQFFVHSLRTVFEAGTQLVLILLFAVLMLASREHLFRSGKRILSQFESIEAGKVLEAVTTLIEKFLLTKMVVIGIISLLSFGALQLLGLKYAFLLGAMTGVLTLLPEVGFIIGLLPVILVAAATQHSLTSHALILASLFLIHLVEANVITPKLVGRRLNLNILSTFVGLFAGGLLWGVWGMFLSVPILGVMRIVFSATPTLQPWAELLSEREDKQLAMQLMSRPFRARFRRIWLDSAQQA